MPFERPSLSDLRSQAAADIAASVPGSDPLLPVANLRILADVLAEGFHAEYAYLDYIARQAVPFTAVDEAFEGWAALKGVTRKQATQATGQGTWIGTPGTLLPAGTPVTRGDGVAYVTLADVSVAGGGLVTADLQAVVAGSNGNLATGTALLLGSAIVGISSAGTATAGTSGADVEAFEDFRTRTLALYAAPPQGGAISDYVEWATQVAGVTRAWCIPHGKGDGTVVVYFMMDLAEAIHGGFPQGTGGVAAAETRDTPATQDLLLVANHIYPLQPVTALVYLLVLHANTVTFSISLSGASLALKAAISAAIDAVFIAFGSPGGVVNVSRIESAIAALAGADGFVITAEACDHGSISPTNGNITSNAGYLPVRGTITWL